MIFNPDTQAQEARWNSVRRASDFALLQRRPCARRTGMRRLCDAREMNAASYLGLRNDLLLLGRVGQRPNALPDSEPELARADQLNREAYASRVGALLLAPTFSHLTARLCNRSACYEAHSVAERAEPHSSVSIALRGSHLIESLNGGLAPCRGIGDQFPLA